MSILHFTNVKSCGRINNASFVHSSFSSVHILQYFYGCLERIKLTGLQIFILFEAVVYNYPICYLYVLNSKSRFIMRDMDLCKIYILQDVICFATNFDRLTNYLCCAVFQIFVPLHVTLVKVHTNNNNFRGLDEQIKFLTWRRPTLNNVTRQCQAVKVENFEPGYRNFIDLHRYILLNLFINLSSLPSLVIKFLI